MSCSNFVVFESHHIFLGAILLCLPIRMALAKEAGFEYLFRFSLGGSEHISAMPPTKQNATHKAAEWNASSHRPLPKKPPCHSLTLTVFRVTSSDFWGVLTVPLTVKAAQYKGIYGTGLAPFNGTFWIVLNPLACQLLDLFMPQDRSLQFWPCISGSKTICPPLT